MEVCYTFRISVNAERQEICRFDARLEMLPLAELAKPRYAVCPHASTRPCSLLRRCGIPFLAWILYFLGSK